MKSREVPYSMFYESKFRLMNTEKLKSKTGNELPVIVSLTTIPFRLNRVFVTVRSILNQSQKPSKIILWLHDSLRNKVPKSLKKLEGDIFSVQFTPLNSSHVKLVPTIAKYPDQVIVTCDDDLMYDENWLKGLYEQHLKHPSAIIAHKVRQIQFDENQKPLTYGKWKLSDSNKPETFLALGSSGILYPVNCFIDQVVDDELYMKLAPKADDLWFKAMTILSNRTIVTTDFEPENTYPRMATQKVSLKKQNIGQNKNNQQWEALVDYFKLKIV